MEHRLVLVRHARAADAHPRGDHERVLTEQGVADAVELGRWLAQQALVPDHVLVSTAGRAQQTLTALLTGLGRPVLEEEQVWSERRVYDGGGEAVLTAVREVPPGTRVLWVLGHEPVMSTTAWELTGGQATVAGSDLTRGFPTATAAVLDVAGQWAGVRAGDARLVAVRTARAQHP